MSTPLDEYRAKVAAAKAAGEPLPPRTAKVVFTAEEAEILQKAAAKTDLEVVDPDTGKPSQSFKVYAKAVIMAQAKVDAAKPTRPRTTKTAEQLLAEKAAIEARLAKMGV